MKYFLLLLVSSVGLCSIILYPSVVHASPDCNEVKEPEQYTRVIHNQIIVRYPLTDPPGVVKKTNCDKLCDLLKID